MKKHPVQNSANISPGEFHKYTASIATDSISGTIELPSIGFSMASINLTTIGATGTSGNVLAKQSVRKGSVGSAFTAPISLASGAVVSVDAFDIPVSGGYFIVDLTGVTFGVVGKIEISIVLKR
jgi:hypothetical protein